MKCSICGTENRDDVDFCRHCGVSIARNAAAPAPLAAATEICPTCHRSHTAPARFCDRCGTKLPARFHALPDRAGPPIDSSVGDSRSHSRSEPNGVGASQPSASTDSRQDATSIVPAAASWMQTGTAAASAGAMALPAVKRKTGLKRQVMRRLGLDTADAQQARRRLQLIAGLAAAVAGIVLSGYLMAQTILVGNPPWQAPAPPTARNSALLAAAAMEKEWQDSQAVLTPAPAAEEALEAKLSPDVTLTGMPDPSDTSGSPDDASNEATPELTAMAAEPQGVKTPRSVAPGMEPVPAEGSVPDLTTPPRPEAAGQAAQKEESRPTPPAAPRSDRRATQLAATSQGWYTAMKAQLNQCATDPNLFTRVVCAEKAKFRYCSPNRWGQVAECVKTQYRDGTSMNDIGGWLQTEPFDRQRHG